MKKTMSRALAILISATTILTMSTVTSLATEATTTRTAAKDTSANTEIYAVTDTAGADYTYYGAKYEPKAGTYYGRTASGGIIGNGRYGLSNGAGLKDESAAAIYTSLEDPYSVEYWKYIYGPAIGDNEHVLLVNMNMNFAGGDCYKAASGTYDARLTADFKYLSTLKNPVFMRIGGEMNLWSDTITADQFIQAYRHIAELAHTYAANVALVFSPNFSSSYNVDMDSFYPGDAYVDWVGCSLYYNELANNGDTANDAFYGVGAYGDPLLNVQQTINLSRLHSKPVMVTEGGSAYVDNGADAAAFAAERIDRAYSYLNMVYPQVKALIYSDTNFGSQTEQYALSGNASVKNSYDRAVAGNAALVHSYKDAVGGRAKYFTKLSSYGANWSGTVTLAAYTYSGSRVTAVWSVDGVQTAISSEYPFTFALDTGKLAAGSHSVTVTFSNGAVKTYSFNKAA